MAPIELLGAFLHGQDPSRRPMNIGPDCHEGKHRACDGRGFDPVADEIIECACTCHTEPAGDAADMSALIHAAVEAMTPMVTNETHAWNLWKHLNTSTPFIAAFRALHPEEADRG